jgi:transposase
VEIHDDPLVVGAIRHPVQLRRSQGCTPRPSNGKRKGQGNTKNGNKYLTWAYLEAANFAVRYNAAINRYLPAQAAQDQ